MEESKTVAEEVVPIETSSSDQVKVEESQV